MRRREVDDETTREALATLRDPSAPAREGALKQLWARLCPRRSAVNAESAAAIPFLIELAVTRSVRGRWRIVELLRGLTEVTSDELERSDAARACLDALLRADASLRALTLDRDPAVRARAVLIRSRLARNNISLRTELLRQIEASRSETNLNVRLAQVLALGELGATGPLQAALAADQRDLQLAAAIALLALSSDDARAESLVREALVSGYELQRSESPASVYPPGGLVSRVCEAGPKQARRFLREFLQRIIRGGAYRADTDLVPVLRVFFPHGVERPPTLEQSAVIETIARKREYFTSAGAAPFLRFGLPARPRQLRTLAASGSTDYLSLVPEPLPVRAPERVLAELVPGGLTQAESLEYLELRFELTDGLLEAVGRLVALKTLRLGNATLTAAGAGQIRRLPRLEVLALEDLTLDPVVARAIAQPRVLPYLELIDVTADALALGELGRGLRLDMLALIGMQISADTLIALRETQTRVLNLVGADLEPGALRALADWTALRELQLRDTALEQTELDLLAACTALDSLTLSHPAASLDLAHLLEALPELRIEYPDPVG